MQHIVEGIMITNTETIAGKVISQNLGVVGGSTVRAKHFGKDVGAFFKNIGGGELKAYTELLEESRTEAIARMVADAQARSADAVVNVRFATSAVTAGAAELFAYGTAVKVE
tara:strand:- start:817 stop:1152 length:336 start_codon:yes stop_codon:yes gene_type:complete